MGLFKMPSLGADMEAGKLTEWLVKPGDKVKHGDIVAVVETQKGVIEIEVFQDGTVQSLLIEPGTTAQPEVRRLPAFAGSARSR